MIYKAFKAVHSEPCVWTLTTLQWQIQSLWSVWPVVRLLTHIYQYWGILCISLNIISTKWQCSHLNTLHRLCVETYEEIRLNFKDAVHIVYTVPCAIAASLLFSSGLSCSIVWITGKSACLSLPDRKKMNCRRTFFRYSRLATLFSLSWFRSRRRTSLFNN